MKIQKEQAYKLLKSQGNKVFSVTFVKKDGSVRKMNCRLGVTKHLKGGSLSYNPADFGLLTVFDMEKGQYRSVNINTLISVNADGESYEVTASIEVVRKK